MLATWLNMSEEEVISAASQAALVTLVFSGPEDRGRSVRTWAEMVRHPPTKRTGAGFGFFFALTAAHPMLAYVPRGVGEEDSALVCRPILERWVGDKRIETRVALLQAIAQGRALEENVSQFLGLIAEGLDDYTSNARGDVGSHVDCRPSAPPKASGARLSAAAAVTGRGTRTSRRRLCHTCSCGCCDWQQRSSTASGPRLTRPWHWRCSLGASVAVQTWESVSSRLD